jgi:hypothetical protein
VDLLQARDLVVAALAHGGVALSDDRGASWSVVATPGDARVDKLAVDPTDPSRLFAGTRPAKLLVSEDAGRTWNVLLDIAELEGAERWDIPDYDPAVKLLQHPSGRGPRVRGLVIPDRREILVGVEVGGIVRSSDAGRTWRIERIWDVEDIHGLRLDASGGGHSVFATTGVGRFSGKPNMFEYGRTAGVYRSDDLGATWEWLWHEDDPQYVRQFCVDHRAPHPVSVCGRATYLDADNPHNERRAWVRQTRDRGRTWQYLGDERFSRYDAEYTAIAPDTLIPGDVLVGTERGEVFRARALEHEFTPLVTGMGQVKTILPLFGTES